MKATQRFRQRARRLLASLAAVLTTAMTSGAATGPSFITERLADGVYAVRPVETAGFGLDANSLVVVGQDGVLVVDAQFSASATREVIAAVRRVTDKPVRWLVNTHWHDDHVSGNAEWQRARPELEVISAAAMRDDMASSGATNRQNFLMQIPGTLGYLRDMAAKGTGIDGAPSDTGEINAIARYATLLERFAAESALTPHVLPTRTFTDSLVLDLGRRRVVLRTPGRGHTRADVIVDVPDAGVIATGDLVIWPVPFVGTTSFPREYGATLGALLARPHRILLPGHGPVLRDDVHVVRTRDMLAAITREVDSLRVAGLPIDSVRKRITLAPWRATFAGTDKLRNALFSTYVLSSAIPKAYNDGAAGARGAR